MKQPVLSKEAAVAVVGGGPAGLALAITLARHGHEVVVLEKRTSVSDLPRAVGLSLRQAEVLRSWGLEEELRAGSDDVDLALVEMPTLAEVEHGVRAGLNVPDAVQSAVLSPALALRVPQDHLESVLADHLATFSTATLWRGAEVTALTEESDGVRLVVDDGTGPTEVRAAYVVAADGAHSRIREAFGIPTTGADAVMTGISAEFVADLWPLVGEHRYALYGLRHPEVGGILIPAGRGRWQFGIVAGPTDDVERLQRSEVLLERIRGALGVPDLALDLVRVSTFSAGAKLAERFGTDRVLLVGDAAHRVTPKGGNGLSLALASAHALGWRLAWVLHGWAARDLLASYEGEHRAFAEECVARSADPESRCRHILTEVQHDLRGRMPHAWVRPEDQAAAVSTLDLVGGALTLFVTSGATVWWEAAQSMRSPVPVEVVELDDRVATALGIRPGHGALLVRPDAIPVGHWYDAGTARADLERAVAAVLGPHRSEERWAS